MRQGYPSNHTYLIFEMATDTVAINEAVAVFQIMGNIYIYFRANVALAIIFLAVNPDDSFGILAFLNDHNTWSGLHGYVEENISASGVISIILHFHCRGANALLRNPASQVTLGPDPSGEPGRLVGEDHRRRRVNLVVLYARRETFGSEAELREYMANLRSRLVEQYLAWADLV